MGNAGVAIQFARLLYKGLAPVCQSGQTPCESAA